MLLHRTPCRSPLSYLRGVVAPPAPLLHLYAPRVAIVVSRRLCYLHCALPTYTSCRSRLSYCGILCCRRRNRAARFDRRAVTMMICPSESHVIRRRVGTYRRSASRLRHAICAADVLHAIRRATDLSLRPRIAPLPQPAHLACRYATDRGSV